MDVFPKVVSLKEINESLQATFQLRVLATQYAGTFLALALFLLFAIPSLHELPIGLVSIGFGSALAYLVMTATLLVSSSIQRQQGPLDTRLLIASLKARLLRTLLYELILVLGILLLGIPLITLIFIGDVQDGGQLLLSIFMIPLLLLVLAQIVIALFGLFVLPQYMASEYGRRLDQFQAFREMLGVGWLRLLSRHAVSSILSLAIALPFWLVVDCSVKIVGFLTASAIKYSAEQKEQYEQLSPVVQLLYEHFTLFPHVWLSFSMGAQFFAGLAAALVYAIPLTVASLLQSASGNLALRAISFDREYFDYPRSA